MEAKDFELPLEGSLSKLALLHTQHEEELPKSISYTPKSENKSEKSLQKKKETFPKKKK